MYTRTMKISKPDKKRNKIRWQGSRLSRHRLSIWNLIHVGLMPFPTSSGILGIQQAGKKHHNITKHTWSIMGSLHKELSWTVLIYTANHTKPEPRIVCEGQFILVTKYLHAGFGVVFLLETNQQDLKPQVSLYCFTLRELSTDSEETKMVVWKKEERKILTNWNSSVLISIRAPSLYKQQAQLVNLKIHACTKYILISCMNESYKTCFFSFYNDTAALSSPR